MITATRSLAAIALLTALGGVSVAQAQTAQQTQTAQQARVVSSTPLADGGYNVVYEYAGRRYTTRSDAPPGATVPVQVSAIGVSTSPVREARVQPNSPSAPPGGWDNVVPEPGVVVSGGAAPAYVQQPPVYAQPYGYAPPVYAPQVYAPPVYAPPVYAPPVYVPSVFAAPIGLSLNFGYSRGWGGGWRHRGW